MSNIYLINSMEHLNQFDSQQAVQYKNNKLVTY